MAELEGAAARAAIAGNKGVAAKGAAGQMVRNEGEREGARQMMGAKGAGAKGAAGKTVVCKTATGTAVATKGGAAASTAKVATAAKMATAGKVAVGGAVGGAVVGQGMAASSAPAGAAASGMLISSKGFGLGMGLGPWAALILGVLGATAAYGYWKKRRGDYDQSETDAEIKDALS